MEGGQGFWGREGLVTVKEYRDIEKIEFPLFFQNYCCNYYFLVGGGIGAGEASLK